MRKNVKENMIRQLTTLISQGALKNYTLHEKRHVEFESCRKKGRKQGSFKYQGNVLLYLQS